MGQGEMLAGGIRSSKVRRCTVALFGVAFSTTMAASEEPPPSQLVEPSAKIITLQSVIDLPGWPSGAAWSPDGKKLLIDWPINKDGVSRAYFVDVETSDISQFFDTLKNGLDDFYWSPDGKIIAVTRSTVVRFLRYPELTLVGEVRAPRTDEEFCAFNTDNGAQFTGGSTALWVACKERLGREPSSAANAKYLVALKIDVAGLKINDRFSIPLPASDKPYAKSFRSSITSEDGKPTLNMIFRTSVNLVKEGVPDISYLANYGLEAKSPLYPPVRTSELQLRGVPTSFPLYSRTTKTVTGAFVERVFKPIGDRGEFFTKSSVLANIDPERKRPIAAHDVFQELQAFTIRGLENFPNRPRLLGMIKHLGKTAEHPSGLGVWRSSDLKTLQVVPTPTQYWGKMSPDGKHYALLSGPKLYLYAIRN